MKTPDRASKIGTHDLSDLYRYSANFWLMMNSKSKDIDVQTCHLYSTCKQTRQKTINWVRNWLGKLDKRTLQVLKFWARVEGHMDNMFMKFGHMKNNRAKLAKR